MLLTDTQKKTIEQMDIDDGTTFGGPAVGENVRCEISRLTEYEYKVRIVDRMICLEEDYFESASKVISFIESF